MALGPFLCMQGILHCSSPQTEGIQSSREACPWHQANLSSTLKPLRKRLKEKIHCYKGVLCKQNVFSKIKIVWNFLLSMELSGTFVFVQDGSSVAVTNVNFWHKGSLKSTGPSRPVSIQNHWPRPEIHWPCATGPVLVLTLSSTQVTHQNQISRYQFTASYFSHWY